MKGYFIPKEQVEELGLLNNPKIKSKLQKVVIAITQNDLDEYKEIHDITTVDFSEIELEQFENWFYKNYFDCIMESISK